MIVNGRLITVFAFLAINSAYMTTLFAQTLDSSSSNLSSIASMSENTSMQEQKAKMVQNDLTNIMMNAIDRGEEIPEVIGLDEDNVTLYLKVMVNNTGERIANA